MRKYLELILANSVCSKHVLQFGSGAERPVVALRFVSPYEQRRPESPDRKPPLHRPKPVGVRAARFHARIGIGSGREIVGGGRVSQKAES